MMELACNCPVVVCCRCTPTHKEKVVQLLKQHTRRPTCAIGVCLCVSVYVYVSVCARAHAQTQ